MLRLILLVLLFSLVACENEERQQANLERRTVYKSPAPFIPIFSHWVYVYTDIDTGCQYLIFKPFGGITPRVDNNGKHICKEY